jgi:hypothetical protein
MRLPGVEPGSIAWKAIILTVGLQTLLDDRIHYLQYIDVCIPNILSQHTLIDVGIVQWSETI